MRWRPRGWSTRHVVKCKPAVVVLAFLVVPPVSAKGPSVFLPPLRPSTAPQAFLDDVRIEKSPPSFLEYNTRTEGTQVGDVCDITSSGSLCFSNQLGMLQASANPPGLVGQWTFDENLPLDSSGHGNHGIASLVHGPSPAGSGHSAIFSKSFVTLPHTDHFQFADFAFTLWVYVPRGDVVATANAPNWCPLLRKGVHAPSADHFESSPALLYAHATGQLRVAVSTSTHNGADAPDGQFIDSNARLRPNRWMHFAVLRHGSKILLYVNGILDAVMPIHGQVLPNKHAVYVGGDPFSANQCTHTVYIDELHIYNRALAPHELEAQAALALGGTSPTFVHLGCSRCDAAQAQKSCPRSRHVCSDMELHAGAYQVARTQGWLVKGTHVWTADRLLQPGLARSAGMNVGLCLCCDGHAAQS